MDVNEQKLEALDLNQQAAMLIKAGNLEKAVEKLDKAIETDPMVVESYRNYGDLCMAKEDYKEAKNYYKKAIMIDKQGLFYFLYGNACFMMDDVHEGLEYYNLAIEAGFDDAEMMFFMGMAYEHLNDDSMALRFYQKACMKNPSRPDFLTRRIATLVRMGEIDKADQYTDELLATCPEMFDGYHIKTTILLEKGDFEQAKAFAKKASDRFPDDTDLMYDYAKAVAMSGDYAAAQKLIDTAKRMKYFENSKRDFILLEAQISADNHDINKAIDCCNECIAMETEDAFENEARFMLMNLYLAEPSYEKSCEIAKQLVAKKLEDDYYYAAMYYQPFCLKQMGKTEEAAAIFKECASIYRIVTLQRPEAIDIYIYRAMCLKELEDYDKALELCDFILGLSDKVAEVYNLKAEIYELTGRKLLAEEERKKAYAIKPELKPVTSGEGE